MVLVGQILSCRDPVHSNQSDSYVSRCQPQRLLCFIEVLVIGGSYGRGPLAERDSLLNQGWKLLMCFQDLREKPERRF